MSNKKEKTTTIADQSIAAVRILVGGATQQRNFDAKDGRAASTLFIKPAIIAGGDVLQPWEVKAYDDAAKIPRDGCYIFGKNALRVGKYGKIDVLGYADQLIFIRELGDQEKTMFEAKATDINELTREIAA